MPKPQSVNSRTGHTFVATSSIPAPHFKNKQASLGNANSKENHKNFENEIVSILCNETDAEQAQHRFNQCTMAASKSIGVSRLKRTNHQWSICEKFKTGRGFELSQLKRDCQTIFDNRTVYCEPLDEKHTILLCPIQSIEPLETNNQEILSLVAPNQRLDNAMMVIRKATAAIATGYRTTELAFKTRESKSLASALELVAIISNSDSVNQASVKLANHLSLTGELGRVAIGINKRGKLRLEAISGFLKTEQTSDLKQDFHQVLLESRTRKRAALFPSNNSENDHQLLAHEQLATKLNGNTIYSHPLITEEGKSVGSWLFAGQAKQFQPDHFERWLEVISPIIANVFFLRSQSEKGRLGRMVSSLRKNTTWFTRLVIPAAIVGIYFLMLIPMTYRVRCAGTVQPITKRYAVAPFDGLITNSVARPGDAVEAGQTVATLDGLPIRWELAGLVSQKKQSLRKREIELANRNISKAFLSELEFEKLTAKEEILKNQQSGLEIKSPIAGVILSGSEEQSEAASVSKGQILFEIGPLAPIKLQVAIPANEISHTRLGTSATVWIEGQENHKLTGKIIRINPRSQIEDSKNVFIAEIELPNENHSLRPGMKGSVRIDCESRPLGWCLFHKPVNFLRSKILFW